MKVDEFDDLKNAAWSVLEMSWYVLLTVVCLTGSGVVVIGGYVVATNLIHSLAR